MAEKMGERIAALVDGDWVEVLVPGFEKSGIVTTELMLNQIGANAVWAGWAPRLIKHHTGDEFELKDKDEVPAVAILEVERRISGQEGKSSLWVRVKEWLVDDPKAEMQGYLEFSPEVWRHADGTWLMPFVAALGGEIPLQKGLRCSFRGDAPVAKLSLEDAAPMEAPWDFTDADYDLEQLARASAWIDGVDGDPHTAALPDDLTKEACHLRHHEPDGTANWKGIVSAYGVLMGARGGWNASDNAKAEALTHLSRDAKRYFERELGEGVEAKKQGLIGKFVNGVKAEFGRLVKLREEVNAQMAQSLVDLLANMSGLSVDEIKAELASFAAPPADTAPDGAKGQDDGEGGGDGEGEGGEDQLAQIAQQVDDLGQRLAALEARVDQLVEGGGEVEDAEAKKGKVAGGGNGDAPKSREEKLKAALGNELKAAGFELGDGALSEQRLIAAIEDYAQKNNMKFGEAYAKLRHKAGLAAGAA